MVTTLTTASQNYLVEGIQLRERVLIPAFLGRFILWAFFHRTDTATQITLSGFANGK
jgi:hypothetical protein